MVFAACQGNGRNPLGNAGAIAVSSLVPGTNPGERLGFLLDALKLWSGSTVYVDSAVHAAEVEHGDRNRAIASLLRHFHLIDETEPALELYFQQCAMRTTCRQLARTAAVLAAGGLAPGSRKRLLSARAVQDTLSMMFACGFHNQSGRFAFEAGLPAKTAISGGIMAVAPGQWGIAVYSPRVNQQATSVRGARALVQLANDLRLGIFDEGT